MSVAIQMTIHKLNFDLMKLIGANILRYSQCINVSFIYSFNSSAGLVTGILQLIAAGVTITCTSAAIGLGSDYDSAWGIWAGIGVSVV